MVGQLPASAAPVVPGSGVVVNAPAPPPRHDPAIAGEALADRGVALRPRFAVRRQRRSAPPPGARQARSRRLRRPRSAARTRGNAPSAPSATRTSRSTSCAWSMLSTITTVYRPKQQHAQAWSKVRPARSPPPLNRRKACILRSTTRGVLWGERTERSSTSGYSKAGSSAAIALHSGLSLAASLCGLVWHLGVSPVNAPLPPARRRAGRRAPRRR